MRTPPTPWRRCATRAWQWLKRCTPYPVRTGAVEWARVSLRQPECAGHEAGVTGFGDAIAARGQLPEE